VIGPLRLVGSGGAFAWFYFLEEPDDDDAGEAEEGEPAEDVDEGPGGGLAEELVVEGGAGGEEGVVGAHGGSEGVLGVAEEGSGYGSGGVYAALAEDASGAGVEDFGLVDGGAAGEEGGGDGDADAAADVSHEVEDAGGVADLLVVQRAVGGGADGDEDEA